MYRRYLLGHVDEATAYVVTDYPYGFKLRTSIRYWIETTKHGSRFVSQTLNPKTDRWNAPKKSTYAAHGAALFLDENGHVTWWGIGEGSSHEGVARFLREAPTAVTSELRGFILFRLKYSKAWAEGRMVLTVDGVARETSEKDRQRSEEEAQGWANCLQMLDSLACAAE